MRLRSASTSASVGALAAAIRSEPSGSRTKTPTRTYWYDLTRVGGQPSARSSSVAKSTIAAGGGSWRNANPIWVAETTPPTPQPPPSQQAAARAKGEARRPAPPRQSEANAAAGRTTGGGGWVVQLNQTGRAARQPHSSHQLRKGTIRHGSPLLEVRLPHDELARRLAVCAPIRCVHHDRLCPDFEREARWWAYSASPALRDTFRRDAFPVGKPANPPRELLDSLEEL